MDPNPQESHVASAPVPHEAKCSKKPAIHLVGSDALVWSVEDARVLREEHRIVAGPVGSLPRNPLQNIFLSLPLKLLPEEVYVLLKRGLVNVVDEAQAYEKPPYRHCIPQRQQEQLHHDESTMAVHNEAHGRVKQTPVVIRTLSTWLPWYRYGHHPEKSSPQELPTSKTDVENLPSAIVSSTDTPSSPSTRSSSPIVITSLNDPRIDQVLQFPKNAQALLRLRIYEYLWQTYKLYIAPGFKFGGDYLLYASDPFVCHAGWVASVKSMDERLAMREIVSIARLASSVQKSHVFCSFEEVEEEGVEQFVAGQQPIHPWTFSVEWAGF